MFCNDCAHSFLLPIPLSTDSPKFLQTVRYELRKVVWLKLSLHLHSKWWNHAMSRSTDTILQKNRAGWIQGRNQSIACWGILLDCQIKSHSGESTEDHSQQLLIKGNSNFRCVYHILMTIYFWVKTRKYDKIKRTIVKEKQRKVKVFNYQNVKIIKRPQVKQRMFNWEFCTATSAVSGKARRAPRIIVRNVIHY